MSSGQCDDEGTLQRSNRTPLPEREGLGVGQPVTRSHHMSANTENAQFIHQFIPGSAPGAPTLLLLHGTGGDETDLLGLGRALDGTAALLSPRGKVLERGMPRFFRRLAEGVFDVEDLTRRTRELAD